MAYQTFRNEYMNMPPVTRAYTTACVITTLAVQLEIASPFQLYFNPILILKQGQVWRLVTTFLFFGVFGFNFFFNMIFTYKYCRMLEEGSFRNRTADFVMMFLFGATWMIWENLCRAISGRGVITVALFRLNFHCSNFFQPLKSNFLNRQLKEYVFNVIFAFFVNLLFLGQAFTIMLVYIWARRNPFVRINFFGLLNFQAPYMPWVLLGFSLLLGNAVYVDLTGIAVGHMYFFMEDVFPNQQGGFKILKTPMFLKMLFDPHPEDADYEPLPEERPGGFDWGNRQNRNENQEND